MRRCTAGPRVALSENRYQRLSQGKMEGGEIPPPPPCAQVYGRPPRCSERESIPASQAGEDGGGWGVPMCAGVRQAPVLL